MCVLVSDLTCRPGLALRVVDLVLFAIPIIGHGVEAHDISNGMTASVMLIIDEYGFLMMGREIPKQPRFVDGVIPFEHRRIFLFRLLIDQGLDIGS
ncbi:hypothetical protein DN523_15220 [Burkholderia multivorans]|nr:hypothetical protein DN471_29280 [Burkholderia multivorans]RAA21231.1 hypothetical protein DN470_25640 [Burkholderia multivorans]RAA29159.1 hypothetical protein DN465_24760 [Burkholderia multivorans]RAA37498.1 hypothetical protein DN472_27825 [Burkholderia multivorans]RAA38008.1 hypothetical protein DN500_26165 [Burkholderia multivorans]